MMDWHYGSELRFFSFFFKVENWVGKFACVKIVYILTNANVSLEHFKSLKYKRTNKLIPYMLILMQNGTISAELDVAL